MNNEKKKSFDFQLYSRQLVCDGMTCFQKLMNSKILIYGLRGLGVEVAKNIILKGPAKVSLFDPQKTNIIDMNSNFYLDEEDINIKRRDEAVLKKLQLLNENVEVNYLEKNSIKEVLSLIPNNYNIVVITEPISTTLSIKIDKICRENKIYFIYGAVFGLSCFLFNDFGDEHVIIEESNAELEKYVIKNIVKNGTDGIVDIILPKNESFLGEDTYVKFKNIEGMTELNYENEKQIRKIRTIDDHSFYIGDISKYNDYIKGGIVEEVFAPKIMNHRSLEERLKEPVDLKKKKEAPQFDLVNKCIVFNTDSGDKIAETELVFLSIKAIFDFIEENSRLPKLNSIEESKVIIEKTKKIFNEIKSANDLRYKVLKEFNESVPKNIGLFCSAEIPCMTSFLGGLIAQEIIKTTGKYIPINQWQIFDFLEYIPNEELRYKDENIPINRYTEQLAIFGEKIINDLQNSKVLLAGSGAVGCEMLKNLGLLGVGKNKQEPYISVVDFDKVEPSNLNRQFLFLKESVGKTKVEASAKAVEQMNKEIKIKPIFEKFCKEKDEIFTNKFFKEQNFILISIDTLVGKEYLDKKATIFEIPMLLGGILGPQAKSWSYIPYETSSFGDEMTKVRNKVKEATPPCTIRYFPSKIEDCMDWARNYFNELFIEPIQKIKKVMTNNVYYESIINEKNNNKEVILSLIDIITMINDNSIEGLVKQGLKIFLENYTLWSKKVFKEYPLDKLNKDGSLFWDSNKLKPGTILFKLEDELCMTFIKNYIRYMSDILGINYDKNEVLTIVQKLSNKENLDILQKEYEDKINESLFDKYVNILEDFHKKGNENELILQKINQYKIIDFQKDNDELGHMDFIHSLTNLKANVYGLPVCDKLKTFKYVGKIAPSTITSISTIVGFNILQMIGLIMNKYQERKVLYNYYINLVSNSYKLLDKCKVVYKKKDSFDSLLEKKIIPIPKEFSSWDKLEIKGPKTVQEIIDIFKEYPIRVNNIDTYIGDEIYENIVIRKNDPLKNMLIQEKEEEDEKLEKYIEDVYFEEKGIEKKKYDEQYLYLKVHATLLENENKKNDEKEYYIAIPLIKYELIN